jgi:hypothetical protein
MMFNKILFPLVFGASILLASCNKDDDPATGDCTGLAPTYTADIKPIISANCLTCHNGPQSEAQIDLSNYSGVKAMADQGRLLGSLHHQGGYVPMPKDAPQLSSDKLQLFDCWVGNGTAE